MYSANVGVGDTATASQYNNARKDIINRIFEQIQEVDNDTALPVGSVIVGNAEAVTFVDGRTSSCYFDFAIPTEIDTTKDIVFLLDIDMSTTFTGNARLSADISVVADAGDTTPTATTFNETVACPTALEVLKVLTLSTIKIAAGGFAAGSHVQMKFSRLGADALDTHTGTLRVFNIRAGQAA